MSRYRQRNNDENERLIVRKREKQLEKGSLEHNTHKQPNERVSCGCFQIVDSEYFSGCKHIKLKDSQKENKKMEKPRNKIRSPRMKASNVQYAPQGRRGNVYVDEEGRRIYRTSGKSGHSRRYVVMDDGELKRGERQENSKVVYQEETEYETVSEADSEYLVPVRPKGERTVSRRIVEGKPRIVTRGTVEGEPSRETYMLRSRPASDYVVRRDMNDSFTREAYVVTSSRPASEIITSRPRNEIIVSRPSERVVTRRVADDSREVYVMRERPSSEKRIVPVENTEVKYMIARPRSEERLLQREEYVEYPREYIVPRPATRDVGCQMTTNYVIQRPPKQRKLLRNVQTQTIRKEKQKKIKTATHYYQRETVEVVHEPEPSTPRNPTPPRVRTPSPPPPRIPTPEPPKQPKPKKKKKKEKENMQIVVKQPNYPEPVYDTVEDLEVVPGSSKIYYEEPKKSPSFMNSETNPTRYAYYEPSEYTSSKKTVPEKDIMADTSTSNTSSDGEKVTTADKFYTIPLKGSTTFYGPYSYPLNRKQKHKSKRRRKQKPVYEQPRYGETPTRKKKQKLVVQPTQKTHEETVPSKDIETYLKKVPRKSADIVDYKGPRSSKKRPDYQKNREARGPVQIEDYGAKLPRGPAFFVSDSPSKNPDDEYKSHPTVMYINPKTDKIEPLKYSVEIEPMNKNKTYELEEDARYVVIPGFDEHSRSKVINNKHQDDSPLIIVEDPKNSHSIKHSRKGQFDMEDTYLEPFFTENGQLPEKSAKGKAHMVRVGGGWMKVEHHRNHHTPLKIYEIPRDANDDKFLYIKSRFNTSKKDVPIAYKKYREEIIRG